MGISGIGSQIGVYPSASNATKTTKTGDEVQFPKDVLKCVSSGNQKTMLCSDALMSYASPQTGESVNIYKAENYTKDNPVYLLKGLDADGNAFEQEVDAGKIDPNHCSYNELMVLNVETGHTSPSDYLHAVAARDKSGTDSFFETGNYIECAKKVMNDMKTVGDYASYLCYDKWIQSILDYAEQTNIDVVSDSDSDIAGITRYYNGKEVNYEEDMLHDRKMYDAQTGVTW